MPTILCIDDNEHGRIVRRHILEERGYHVVTAKSGRDGLDKFKNQKVDLAIVDYLMPEMNGQEVIQHLRKAAPQLPIILLSGYADTLALDRKVPEADAVLHKGRAREVKELLETVERLLGRRSRKAAGRVAGGARRRRA